MTGQFPIFGVNHKDGQGINNRWENLRASNQSQNVANGKIRRDNTSGFKGVHFNKRDKCYQAYIGIDGKLKHLGSYDSAEEAHAAYIVAANIHFGEFARPV